MSGRNVTDEAADVSLTSCRRLHDGFRPVDALDFRYRAYGESSWEESSRREILRSPPIVAVLPYDPAAGRVVLLRQFRLAAHLATGKGVLVEIVAGAVDEGEAPEAAARRELAEETGLQARRLLQIGDFLSSPGICDERIALYIAEVDASDLPGRSGHDVGEVTHPFACAPEEAIAAADAGRIANVVALLALNWFDRHKDDVNAMLGEEEG